ncbi:MAG: RecX family transcriptional regulator [Myxococcales bacterium]|nr:RecX family transcriptional regulator [Myxococcales bacterium]
MSIYRKKLRTPPKEGAEETERSEFSPSPPELSLPTAERIITAMEPQKKNPDRLSIYLDGKYAFGLPRDLVVQHMLCKGCRIDEEKERALLKEAQILRAKEITLNFLSYQARTEQEVEKKLKDRGIAPDIAEQVIQRFRDLGYLNDPNFARSFAQSRLEARGQGPRRIQMELKKRGISANHIQEAIQQLEEKNDLVETITPHAQKRWQRLKKEPNAQKRRQKLLDFLLRQGLGFDLAQRVFQQIEKDDPIDDIEIEEAMYIEPEDLVEEPAEERDVLEEIRPLAQKRWERLGKSETNLYKRRKKLSDYLRRQGFSFDAISSVLEELA